ncbi:pyridoxal-phosphate dependent enzyme [Streptomyces canus]|uniref:pyridoxal-phosphate dependent enzyme n=1 Tax=Streptomyces canus TaxID=58343 RepID=UPI0033B21359
MAEHVPTVRGPKPLDRGDEAALEQLTGIGDTPVVRADLTIGAVRHEVLLKLEGANPTGSVKARTALSLVRDLHRRGLLTPGRRIVESSSGNLAVALAHVCRALGIGFTAVVDPKITRENRSKLEQLGAELVMVGGPDPSQSYLGSRLEAVAEICKRDPQCVWPDQYANPANPQAHYLGTGPELLLQAERKLDAVFVAASTGGTLCGVARYLRAASPRTRVVGVDAVGSVIFGQPSGPRLLVGIGSSQVPAFPMGGLIDESVLVSDEQAFRAVHQLHQSGVSVGGSSGAAFYAAATYLQRFRETQRVAVICPDGGTNYASSLFSRDWLDEHGFDAADIIRGTQLPLPDQQYATVSVHSAPEPPPRAAMKRTTAMEN